jgi:hypothetical protein
MPRWLVLAAFSIAPLALGCGSSLHDAAALQVGLANAPNLGGSPAAEGRANGTVAGGVTDVVANGNDSCGRYAEHGVLRNQFPPCPSWLPPHPAATVAPPVHEEVSRGLVQPWVNHFYTGWPCPDATASSRKPHAWSALDATVAECAVPAVR